MITRRTMLGAGAAALAGTAVATTGPAAATGGAGDHDAGEIARKLERYVDAQAERGRFSGTVLLDLDGRDLVRSEYGAADRETGRRNTLDTSFSTGSLAKFFTGVLAGRQAQDDRITFDAAFGDVLPELRNESLKPLTLHQLLTHTAGLPKMFPEKTDEQEQGSAIAYLPQLEPLTLVSEPGARYSYSNAGFLAAAIMIEQVRGPFGAAMREDVFRSARMRRTEAIPTDRPEIKIAHRYLLDGTEVPPAVMTGAGGWYTTVVDLVAFARCLFGHKIIDAEHTELVTTGKVDGGGGRYGYGCGERFVNGHRIVGHNGGSPGVNAQLSVYPDDGFTLAVLCNLNDPQSDDSPGVKPIVDYAEKLITG